MKLMLLRCVAVGCGGFLGALARYAVVLLFARWPMRFPLATLVINVAGSFFLGWFIQYFSNRQLSDTTRLAIAVGFVGAFTTFSTYMNDSMALARQGAMLEAAANVFGSLILGLAAVFLGVYLAT